MGFFFSTPMSASFTVTLISLLHSIDPSFHFVLIPLPDNFTLAHSRLYFLSPVSFISVPSFPFSRPLPMYALLNLHPPTTTSLTLVSFSLHLKLASMASECSWSDAVVELQVWCQLATFCHDAKDHNLLLCCTETALKLEEAAAKSLNNMPCPL